MEARRACSGQPPPASCAICNGNYNLSAGALARDGTKVRDFWWRHKVFCAYVEPGENRTFEINLEPGFFVFQYGPELIVTASSDNRVERIDITHHDSRPAEPMRKVVPRSLTYNLTNASPARIVAFALSIGEAELAAYKDTPPGVRLAGFLSGSRLLSAQTFRDLFPSETVMSTGGLAIKRVALLFTDIKGSTALYDRIGDIQICYEGRIARCHCSEPWRAGQDDWRCGDGELSRAAGRYSCCSGQRADQATQTDLAACM